MQKLVDDAVGNGATVRAGGTAIGGRGYFFEATLLDYVPVTAEIANTEIFGPIAAVQRFATQGEAIAGPTTPSMASPATSSRRTWIARSMSPMHCTPDWLGSTKVCPPAQPHRSAG